MRIKDSFETGLSYSLLIMFFIFLFIGLIKTCKPVTSHTTSPVESVIIDSLKEDNAIIENKIDSIDSIINNDIYEIKNISNDSTLKLFYELIGK